MSRPKDQQRFEVWINRYERERIDVLALTHNLPDLSPTTREAMERHLARLDGRD